MKLPISTKDLRTFQCGKNPEIGGEMFSQDRRKANERSESEASGVNTKNCPY